tara:strand:- start:3075 stop:8162 length:5088 start_codon:yes stop_codon:yes gene_type:complete
MDVKYWEGGLQIQEVNAIERLEAAFTPNDSGDNNAKRAPQNQLAAQLGALTGKSTDPMWPWKGYAGFRFVDARKEGEFDLVIVTHKNVLIIELKHWHGEITSYGDNWQQNGESRGRSPVSVTQNKVFLLKKKLEKIRTELPGKKVPWIDFRVVITGNARYNTLPEKDKHHVLTLDQFVTLADPVKYDREFNSGRTAPYLNKDFSAFDRLISDGNVRPKELVVNGYRSELEIFSHPSQVYKEFQAVNENNKKDRALLRHWKFSNIGDSQTKTPEGRYQVVSRERDLLSYISHSENELYKNCLRSISNPSMDDMTQEYCELYELPSGHFRFNEFIDQYIVQYPEEQRLVPVKTLLNQFARLHGINVAHRDIGSHSVWLSPTNAIALSNFIAAYHQPIGTVGPRRDILSVGCIPLPEAVSEDPSITPFSQDVFSLGVLCWHILKAKRLPNAFEPEQLIALHTEVEIADNWYAPVILQAISLKKPSSYSNAATLLEAINDAQPDNSQEFLFDDSIVEAYRQHKANPYIDYPVNKQISSGQLKQIYRSDDQIVKLWTNANPSIESAALGYRVTHFLQKVDRLQSLNLDFLPAIRAYGIAPMVASLFLVTEAIEGKSWEELDVTSQEVAYPIIDKLICTIERLHELNINHGDLHPGNILLTNMPLFSDALGEDSQLFLIDIPDFNTADDDTFNHRYSPLNIDTCSPFERDIFATMRMSIELLGMDWDTPSERDIPQLRSVIEQECADSAGFLSLERFKDALIEYQNPKSDNEITISITECSDGDFKILPDNGKVYIRAEKSLKGEQRAVVHFHGIGGAATFVYAADSDEFFATTKIRKSEAVSHYDSAHAILEREVTINLVVSAQRDFSELSSFFKGDNDFREMISELLKEPKVEVPPIQPIPSRKTEQAKRPLLSLKKGVVEVEKKRADHPLFSERTKAVKPLISAEKVWRAVLDTEALARPSIEVAEEPRVSRDGAELIILYSSKTDVLGGYESDEILELTRIVDEKQFNVGLILLQKSNTNRITIKMKNGSSRIAVGDTLHLTTRLEKSSFIRRKMALNRILTQQSVIPDLMSYFEQNSSMKPTEEYELPSDDDFQAYDRKLSDGTIIGLNDAQKSAFRTLISKGPVGFLQGPPGTGKTEFIAAFCHYLVSKVGVKNILMVSQSHEAVNTAAERIRSHCLRLDTELDIVRFSNRENSVSESMLDVYSKSLVSRANSLFQAERKHRLCAQAKSLGLNPDYIARLTDAEDKVSRPLKQLRSITADLETPDFTKEEHISLKAVEKEIRSRLATVLSEDFDLELGADFELASPLILVREKIANSHGIAPHEAHKAYRLLELANDFVERLSSGKVNYDEFLMRSRTLVCGTCVGVGLRHLSVSDTIFDWVIIDEAARSSPSELAIAMQSGKRILLVGDHRQLPPTYQREHEDAIASQLRLQRSSSEFSQAMASDFEKAFESEYGRKCGTTLTIQYRMQKPIGDLVSNVFYEDRLETGKRSIPNCFDIAPDELKSIVTWIDIGVLGRRANHQENKSRKSFSNQAETAEIMALLRAIEANLDFCGFLLDETGDEDPAIGVICMYSEQKRMLQKAFHSQNWRDDFLSMVKIDTVDSYQGKENRIVIVSLVLSSIDKNPRFLRLPNRINVAMSRAMDRLIVVGDLRMWAGNNSDLPLGKVASYIQARQTDSRYLIKGAEDKQMELSK